ncbi:tetratricopeptide repeat protein [Plantactinospora sp. S1510]|uniref:Tetratricopeptide repeat protein n=1 Tax=Plantactinospora alkalitolerans TaxID=2789879 RepID=A0ABS0GZQ2_9ACTN|nr:tetratricopeptide repeat protein [Plantactinospora alkalitolerans]MBF9131677.1 tetratricopeptide repeat protein [Plantactinospora alkalitolerans]
MDQDERQVAAAEFGRWVKARRTELMLSQEQLAARARVSIRTVRNLEAGRSGTPRLETRRLVVAALGADEHEESRAAPAPVASRAAASSAVAVVPAQLPVDTAGFVGRSDELRRLDALLEASTATLPGQDGVDTAPANPVTLLTVAGTAGVGKTALAVRWAHRVRHRFPDGQLFVDLRGFAPGTGPVRPLDALSQFLRALGVRPEEVPTDIETAAAMYRSMLADRRVLVLLDNGCDPDQVRPLLPGGANNLVLVTSRDHLSGLIAREGATRLTMGLLQPDEARALLGRILGDARVSAEPEATAELARLCAFLPMALRIAAANLHGQPYQTVAGYAATLRPDRLSELAVHGEVQSAVRAAIDQSYFALPESARQLFRRLGLMPCPDVNIESAAAIGDVTSAEAAVTLGLLARVHLLEQRGPRRFGYHDLLCLYARERAHAEEEEPARQAVVTRFYDYYLEMVDSAANVLHPQLMRLAPLPGGPAASDVPRFDDPGQASGWLDAEHANLLAAITHAAVHGPRPAAWRLADGIRGHLMFRMDTVDWMSTAGAGLAAARADDDLPGQAAAHLSLATLYSRLGDQERAASEYSLTITLARRAGWLDGAMAAHGSLGNVYLRLGQAAEAAVNFADVLTHARRTGRAPIEATARSNLGVAWLELGRLAASADEAEKALAASRLVSARSIEANTLANLGQACHALGRFDRARECFEGALALHRQLGDQDSEGWTLCGLAALHCDTGDHAGALRLAEDALDMTRGDSHNRYRVDALNTLGTILERLGRHRPAVDHHRQARDLAGRSGYRYAMTVALLGEGAALRQLDEPTSALDAVTAALDIAASSGYRVLEGSARSLRAELHLDAGEPGPAATAAELAVAVQRETGYRLGEGCALVVLGRALTGAGDVVAGRAHWHAALALLRDIGAAEARTVRALLSRSETLPAG